MVHKPLVDRGNSPFASHIIIPDEILAGLVDSIVSQVHTLFSLEDHTHTRKKLKKINEEMFTTISPHCRLLARGILQSQTSPDRPCKHTL